MRRGGGVTVRRRIRKKEAEDQEDDREGDGR